MTITLHAVNKSVIEVIDRAGIYHFEYGDGRQLSTKLEAIKGAHMSEYYLYLEGDDHTAVIDNRSYSYLEMM